MHRTWCRFHLRPSCVEAQHEKRVILVFGMRSSLSSEMEVEKMATVACTALRIWPFAFAPPPCSSSQTRATPGEERGRRVSIPWMLALTLRSQPWYKHVFWHARRLRLTLTWMSPFMVDISDESSSLWSLHTAGYSSKRYTVHTQTQRAISDTLASFATKALYHSQ